MNEIKTLLKEEIVTDFGLLKDMPIDDENFKPTIDELIKLVDRSIEIEKLENEREEKASTQKAENEFRLKQMEQERKDRKISHGIALLGIAAPLGVSIWGIIASFNFEKEGTVTTIMGRGLLNQIIPKLKK